VDGHQATEKVYEQGDLGFDDEEDIYIGEPDTEPKN
jgi:hypothetical protein